MAKNQRVEGFKALVASDQANGYHMEDVDGEYRLWRDMSAAGKLRQIADNAAYSGVPFEPFAEAAGDALRPLPAVAREEAALRLVLRGERELHALEKLLPQHDRLEAAPPLAER